MKTVSYLELDDVAVVEGLEQGDFPGELLPAGEALVPQYFDCHGVDALQHRFVHLPESTACMQLLSYSQKSLSMADWDGLGKIYCALRVYCMATFGWPIMLSMWTLTSRMDSWEVCVVYLRSPAVGGAVLVPKRVVWEPCRCPDSQVILVK